MPAACQEEETFFAGAYWGARRESAAACAQRAEALFATVANVDPAFSQWFRQGTSRKDALLRPIAPTREALEKLIRDGRDRVVEELGFRFSGWNGASDDQDGSAFNVTCGGYSERVGNACVFELPSRGPNADRVLAAPILTGLVRCLATAWEPDFAVGMSSEQLQSLDPGDPAALRIGWVTYIARQRGRVPLLPAPVRIEPVEDKGTLIVLTPERFTARNPEHLALAARVTELLDRAGLVRPV